MFAQPAGVDLGNGLGALRTDPDWGEVRGRNGIIVAEPTPHAKAGEPDHGVYQWWSPGEVPELPDDVVEALGQRRRREVNPRHSHGTSTQANARVRGLLAKLNSAGEGERNKLLHWTACRFAEMVEGGLVDEQMAYDTLVDIGMGLDLDEGEATATVASGLGWSS